MPEYNNGLQSGSAHNCGQGHFYGTKAIQTVPIRLCSKQKFLKFTALLHTCRNFKLLRLPRSPHKLPTFWLQMLCTLRRARPQGEGLTITSLFHQRLQPFWRSIRTQSHMLYGSCRKMPACRPLHRHMLPLPCPECSMWLRVQDIRQSITEPRLLSTIQEHHLQLTPVLVSNIIWTLLHFWLRLEGHTPLQSPPPSLMPS